MRLLAGRYRLVEQVGRGGSAIVWRAVDERLERTVAVKLLATRGVEQLGWRDAMRGEARAAARLNHPNVAALYDYGEARSPGLRRAPFLVLEYVDGETLGERLRREGALEWPEAVRICADLAAGIDAVHDAGLVHRDVKPGNVLLAAAGPKLVDLGVARAVGAATVNGRGEILGTPAYMAPEQLRGEAAVPASDVYALGLVLSECLTGHAPQRPQSPGRAAQPTAVPVAGVPEAIQDLRRRCLAPEAADRPTARTVAHVLATTAATTRVPLRPPAEIRPDPRPTVRAPSRRARAVRRGALVAGTPVVLAAAVLAVQLPGLSSTPDAAEGATETPAPGGCTVRYSAERSSDGTFGAELTVAVTGTPPRRRPMLSFRLPPGQRLAPPQDRWQSGRQVHIPLPDASAGEVGVALRGTYTDRAGTAADRFTLSGEPCRKSSALVTIAGDVESPVTATAPASRERVTAPAGQGAGDSPRPSRSTPPATPSPVPVSDEPGRPSPTREPTGSTSPSRSTEPSPPEPTTPPPPTDDPSPSATPTAPASGGQTVAPTASGQPTPTAEDDATAGSSPTADGTG